MSSSRTLINNSFSVQRATHKNIIESTRLQQTLRYIDKANVHQQRLANRDMRLLQNNISYIQASSGQSLASLNPLFISGTKYSNEKTPCFMYGERIWSRKRKRLLRPATSIKRSPIGYGGSSNCFAETEMSTELIVEQTKQRPHSVSEFTLSKFSERSQENIGTELSKKDFLVNKFVSMEEGRLTPHYEWEDDVSAVTKTILSAQERAQSGKRPSVYQSSVEVMNSEAFRNVRGVLRKIRVAATTYE